MHFTRMGGYEAADVPIIVRGEGCYLEDSNGKRYLDALAGLFSVNIGYSFGEEIGQAALEQMRELPFYTNWSYAHPRAIELAAEVASLAPGDLNRVFFCSGGSEAVESAWKLARQYYAARGERKPRGAGDGGDASRRARRRDGRAAAALQGDRAEHCVPRHDHGRALDQRHPGAPRRRSSRSWPRSGTSRTRTATTARRTRPRWSSRGSCSTSSSRRSSRWARRPSASCTWSRCRTPAALHASGGLLARRARDLRPLRHPALRRRGHHRLRAARLLVRLRAVRHPAGHRHEREGPLVLVRGDRRRDRDGQGHGAVHGRDVDVLARDHVRRAPGDVRDRAQEHRDHEARADRRARSREAGRLPRDARSAPRPADRRRPSRNRVLLRDRAGQGQGHARVLHRGGVREAPARFPLERALRRGDDLPRGRPRRPGDPDLAAARRRPGGVRRDRVDSRRRAHRGRRRSCAERRSLAGLVVALHCASFARGRFRSRAGAYERRSARLGAGSCSRSFRCWRAPTRRRSTPSSSTCGRCRSARATWSSARATRAIASTSCTAAG